MTQAPVQQEPAMSQELIRVARLIEDMKQDCGMDPESPAAIRNGRLMIIAAILRGLAAAPVQAAEPVRMLSDDEVRQIMTGFADIKRWREAREVQIAFMRVNAGRTIPKGD
jgi:hypothetical protein